MDLYWLATAGFGLTAGAFAARHARRRALDRWLPAYVLSAHRRRTPERGRPVHLLLCVADHFEPKLGGATPRQASRRVRRWVESYPRLAAAFRDSDGRPPRHTFFYPVEEYEPAYLDGLAGLCRAGYGEVEIHLHHDNDTADNLRATLTDFRDRLADWHGLLARDRATGAPAYGFIHGNWALDNSRPDGRYCGVNNELDVLRETGCYADFTLPSAPSPTQTRTINSIYYAVDDPRRPKSHDRGVAAGSAVRPADGLLMIQGPLLLDWRRRKWGLVPRIENGCVQGSQPQTAERIDMWLRARVQVPTRPDWFFVKLHTHGANEANEAVLLGEPMARFHRALAERAAADPLFRFHYVTAREMFNLARAAEAGWRGPVCGALNFELEWNGGPADAPFAATAAEAPA
jgi:hypothetical protein